MRARGVAVIALLAGVLTCGKGEPTGVGPMPGTLNVSPGLVRFTALAGGANPASQTIDITETGEALTGLAIESVDFGPGGSGWLQATLLATTPPTQLTLQPAIAGLAPGSYAASVSLTASNASGPQWVAVTLEVVTSAVIGLSTDSVAVFALPGGASPAPRTVTIANAGGGALTGLTAGAVTYTQGAGGWLQASLNRTTAPATLTLLATSTSLAPGSHVATVAIGASGASNAPRQLTVTLLVSTAPVIGLSTGSLVFKVLQGSGNPPAQAITLTNAGGGALTNLSVGTVSYTQGTAGWLQVTFAPNGNPATLTLQPTTTALAAGNYAATLPVLASGAANSPASVQASLVVQAPPPVIALSPTTLPFTATAGGTLPIAKVSGVTNAGGGSLADLGVSIDYGNGPSGWLGAQLGTQLAPTNLTVVPLTTNLAPGTYTAFVNVASASASNSPQILTTTYTVAAASPALVLSSRNLVFNAFAGGADPTPSAVSVSNGGGGSLAGLTASVTSSQPTGGWLAYNLGASAAPATLTVSPLTAGLTPQLYTGTLSVSSTPAVIGSPDSVTVRFAVIDPPIAASYTRITVGRYHVCALVTGGAAYCWGNNEFGQLGIGTVNVAVPTPQPVAGGIAFAAISSRGNTTCGLDMAGAAYCWGDNTSGSVGDGTRIERHAPVPVAGGHVFRSLVVGFFHACGLEASGVAWCWGDNGLGQLGDGTLIPQLTPAMVSGGHSFTELTAGVNHTCGRAAGGAAWCWGGNVRGELGDGTNLYHGVPVAVGGGLTFAQLSAGGNITCGLTTGGAAFCWGYNAVGAFGNGNGLSSSTPSPAAIGVNLGAIRPGTLNHTCGITTAGDAYCWGSNQYGSLGDGTAVLYSLSPNPVIGGLKFTELDAGTLLSCGLVASPAGSAYCWGTNPFGAFGDGAFGDKPFPNAVFAP